MFSSPSNLGGNYDRPNDTTPDAKMVHLNFFHIFIGTKDQLPLDLGCSYRLRRRAKIFSSNGVSCVLLNPGGCFPNASLGRQLVIYNKKSMAKSWDINHELFNPTFSSLKIQAPGNSWQSKTNLWNFIYDCWWKITNHKSMSHLKCFFPHPKLPKWSGQLFINIYVSQNYLFQLSMVRWFKQNTQSNKWRPKAPFMH